MSQYQALYRAWRPEQFKDIYGQEAVTRALRRQVVSGQVSHAYLFCGSRGTGKTTTAKVLSRALNCIASKDGEPCGECEVCRQLKNASSLDVLEIDAASNNGVDEVRALRDRISYPPTVGKYKVYIIDEVHMLSTGAFNALLKTLEEPPAHAVFILATTEPQKLPATVLSRCQRYDFKRISVKDIAARLEVVLNGIGRKCSPEAIEEIAVSADGAMRDALSLLDMCLSYTDGVVEAELVRQVLGSNGREFMFEFTDALSDGDAAKALQMIDAAMTDGRDPAVFTREVAAHLRTVLIAGMTGEKVAEIAQLTTETAKRFIEQSKRFETARLMRAMDTFIKAEGDMRYVAMPRSIVEYCAVSATRISNEKTDAGLTERIEALEKKLSEGIPVQPAQPAKSEPAPKPAPAQKQNLKPAAPAVNAGDKALFEQALKEYCETEAAKPVLYQIRTLKFRNVKDDTVFAYVPVEISKSLLDDRKSGIEAQLSAVFGRRITLNIAPEPAAAASAQGVNTAVITQVADTFGRDNTVISD